MRVSGLIEELIKVIEDVGNREIVDFKMDLEDDVSYANKLDITKGDGNAEHNTETGESKTD